MADNKAKGLMRSATAFGTPFILPTNAPHQYGDRAHPYMRQRSADMAKSRAYLSSDFVMAECQGLTEDFFSFRRVGIRLADITSETASATRKSDDYKQILFSDARIAYFPIGAKIRAMGSTWLCINPSNLSSALPTAVIARCNASYNFYDEYGNVCTEPIVIERHAMFGNTSKTPDNLVMMDGYFNVICQKNENTSRLADNKRILLGKRAYHITGFADFVEEFSGDADSVRLLTFTIRVEEPTESDDLERGIADGKQFSFSASIDGTDQLSIGERARFTAYFLVNGVLVHRYLNEVSEVFLDVDAETGMLRAFYPDGYRGTEFSLLDGVLTAYTPPSMKVPELSISDGRVTLSDLEENGDMGMPVTFLWESDHPSVASVNDDGTVTAHEAGETVIRAILAQNPSVFAEVHISVVVAPSRPYVEFIGAVAASVSQFSSVTLSASLFEAGKAVPVPLSWRFSGADARHYAASVSSDGLSCTVTCLSPSKEPLMIVAAHGDADSSVSLILEGY